MRTAKTKTQLKHLEQGEPLYDDALKLRGYLEYCLRDARSGRIVRRGKGKNVVVFFGRSYALKQLVSGNVQSAQVLQWLALGTSSGATNSSQSQLDGYFSIKGGASATTAITTNTNAACTFTLAVSWASDQTHASSSAIGEFALYNSSGTAGATMFNRLQTTAINFASTNTLAVTVTITN